MYTQSYLNPTSVLGKVYLIFIFCANELETMNPKEVLELTRYR